MSALRLKTHGDNFEADICGNFFEFFILSVVFHIDCLFSLNQAIVSLIPLEKENSGFQWSKVVAFEISALHTGGSVCLSCFFILPHCGREALFVIASTVSTTFLTECCLPVPILKISPLFGSTSVAFKYAAMTSSIKIKSRTYDPLDKGIGEELRAFSIQWGISLSFS